MLSFILRRIWHSLWVLLGVILLTFLMFQMAAGDPAAAVLGKNPAPAEIEALRRELNSDLPLFYGNWRTSEVYTSCEFNGSSRQYPGITQPDNARFTPAGLEIKPDEKIIFKRHFQVPDLVQLQITGKGRWMINDRPVELSDVPLHFTLFSGAPAELFFTPYDGKGVLTRVQAFRENDSRFNSQLGVALKELVTFKSEFPYISVLNFGKTVTTREPINDIIARGIWPSVAVMLPIFIGELVLGIILALLATAVKDSWLDRILLIVSVAAMSISYLVLIIAGQWFMGYYLGLFPVWGWGDWRYLSLPILIGIASGLGGGVRFYRTVFVNELKCEYLRTASAKGCSGTTVYCKHLLRNALIPIIARASSLLPFIFTGSLLLESFFGIPGLGYASIDALNNSDLALLKALTIVNALFFVVINLLADLACAWADPRIRME